MLCQRAAPLPAADEPPELDMLLDDLLDMSDAYPCSTDVLRQELPALEPPAVCAATEEPAEETGAERDLSLASRNEMASGQAHDAAESQPLLGATITSDMDLTDMSFNDFFSFTDDVGETLDREMHHSLFGDSGLGMDLGSLMAGPPAEDQLLPDFAAQLFGEVSAAGGGGSQEPAEPPPPPPASPAMEGGITAESREDLLAFFEEHLEPEPEPKPVSQSQSCPVSPAAAAAKPAPPPPPLPPPPPPPPRTVKTARAGQSLLKPSVTAGLRLKAQEGRRVLVSAPATRRVTPANSRPATPADAPAPETDGGSLRALIVSLKKRAAEEADPKLKRLLLSEARQARSRLKSTARRAKKLSELYSGAQTQVSTPPPPAKVPSVTASPAPGTTASPAPAVVISPAPAAVASPRTEPLPVEIPETPASGSSLADSASPLPSVGSTCSETESVGSTEAVSQLRTQCELLVKHVRRTSQSASGDASLPPIQEDSVESSDRSVASEVPSQTASPIRPALWDHSYCSRDSSGDSSPAPGPDGDALCKVPDYLEPQPPAPPSPVLEKVPSYVQGVPPADGKPPSRKKLSLTEYRQRRSALNSLCGSPGGGSPLQGSIAATAPAPQPVPAPRVGPLELPPLPLPELGLPPVPPLQVPIRVKREPLSLLTTPAKIELLPAPVRVKVEPPSPPVRVKSEPRPVPAPVLPAPLPVPPPAETVPVRPTERPPPPPSELPTVPPPPVELPTVPPPPPPAVPPPSQPPPPRARHSSPPRGYRLDTPTESPRRGRDRDRTVSRHRRTSGSDRSVCSSASSDSGSSSAGRCYSPSIFSGRCHSPASSSGRCHSPDDPMRYNPADFEPRPDRRRHASRSRSPRSRSRSRSPARRSRSWRPDNEANRRAARRHERQDREREREQREHERRRREEQRREERRRQQELANQRDAVGRKVVYVNGLSPSVTREDLRRMFGCFGPITKIRIKERDPAVDLYREQRDGCYAFVSFQSHGAAVAAQAHGSQKYPHLEVKFGGRREFCLDQYADQDADLNNPAYYGVKGGGGPPRGAGGGLDFDTLLRMEMQRVKQKAP